MKYIVDHPRSTLKDVVWYLKEEYKEYPDPGDPEKKILIADVRTKIRGCKEPVRTILLLNEKEKGKDRFYPIYTNDEVTSAYDLLVEYRSRQNHELCYRVMTHDLSLNALPKSYPLNPKVEKVQFRDKHLTLVGWIKALAFNINGAPPRYLTISYKNKSNKDLYSVCFISTWQ
ncbi:MAG: hypothetical protein WAV32_02210 [Halobacteriota archaeon]